MLLENDRDLGTLKLHWKGCNQSSEASYIVVIISAASTVFPSFSLTVRIHSSFCPGVRLSLNVFHVSFSCLSG